MTDTAVIAPEVVADTQPVVTDVTRLARATVACPMERTCV
jgi:hypothetical protein